VSERDDPVRDAVRGAVSDWTDTEQEFVSMPVRYGERLPAMSGDRHEMHQVRRRPASEPDDVYLFMSRRDDPVFPERWSGYLCNELQ
jgi:hypothetical protein